MVGRAGGRSKFHQLALDELGEALLVQHRLRLLEQLCLVRAPAPLHDVQQLVLVAGCSEEIDLRGKVGAGVLLVEHGLGGDLRVAQVVVLVRVVHPERDVPLVRAAGHDIITPFSEDRRRARVLAAGEDALRGHFRVVQQLLRHVPAQRRPETTLT